MGTIKYDGLASDYLQTDGSVSIAIPRNSTELSVLAGQASQALSLEDYAQLAIIFENNTTVHVDYVELLGNQQTDATIEIVKDVTASSGYALKMTGAQTLIFGTPISYVSDILKRITCKVKKATGNTQTLYASVIAYKDGIYNGKTTNNLSDYVKVCMDGSETISDSTYTSYKGYIKGTGSNYVTPTDGNLPDNPSELPDGTDEIALVLESTGGVFYIDVIALEEVENSIRNIPDGQDAYDASVNFNTRNDRIYDTPNIPVVTTPSSYVLNDDGSIDITVTWDFNSAGDAGNIDGFAVYPYSGAGHTIIASDTAYYVSADTGKYTLHGVTINNTYTFGVQAYRMVDRDAEHPYDIVRSGIAQTEDYCPSTILPSTTTYSIQPNVDGFLGNASAGSCYLHGIYPNGSIQDTEGNPIAGKIPYRTADNTIDIWLTINAQSVICTDFTIASGKTFTAFLILNTSDNSVACAKYDIDTDSFKNKTTTYTTGVIIGSLSILYDGVDFTITQTTPYAEAITLNAGKKKQTEIAWEYLQDATDGVDFGDRVETLGIENAFITLAVYNAFINKLTVNEAFIDSAKVRQLEVLSDNANRKILIGNEGILVKDANGEIIHDLPDAPIQTNNYYLGHILWFEDLSTYKIYDSTSFAAHTWTDVVCITANNTNGKAGIFRVYLNSDNNNNGVTEPFNFVWLRPKGTSWDMTPESCTPEGRFYMEMDSGTVDSTASSYFLICPIGTDNKIQFNADASPSGNYKRIVIAQLGVLI